MASKAAYARAGVTDPLAGDQLRRAARRLYLVRDPDLRGHGAVPLWRGRAVRRSGAPFLPDLDYGLAFGEGRRTKDESARYGHEWPVGVCPVNPSGGLIACGHPVGATGLMQGVFALWQLQARSASTSAMTAQSGTPPRRDPQPCRHGHVCDGQHLGKRGVEKQVFCEETRLVVSPHRR